jgi:hypothetical protein
VNWLDALISLALRGLAAGLLFYFASRVKYPLIGPAFIVLGAVILAPPLARLLAESSGGLFYPGGRGRKEPMYSIPEARRARGEYEEAIADLRRIAAEYPRATRPYELMLTIAIVDLKDAARAEQIYRQGLAALRKRGERDELARFFATTRTRLDPKADWQKELEGRRVRLPWRGTGPGKGEARP